MARDFLNKLKALDIHLWAEGDRLKWDAPVGLVKGNIKEQMRKHKNELLVLLRNKEADTYNHSFDLESPKEEHHQVDSKSKDTTKDLPLNTIILGDCLKKLKSIPDNSIDLVVTDPPFGIGFMGKAWDTFKPNYINDKMDKDGRGTENGIISTRPALVAGAYDHSVIGNKAFQEFIHKISEECLRVLRPGAFMFMCMTPRQDSLARAIVAVEDAGFKAGFTSMYWAYASGFPKAHNISKSIDRKLDSERKIIGRNPNSRERCDKSNTIYKNGTVGKTAYHTEPATEEAKKLNGSYAGFQPKPAVEVIIVAMKPCDKKTFTDQALSNGKGVTWLDDCRIPYADDSEKPPEFVNYPDMRGDNYGQGKKAYTNKVKYKTNQKGRFPGNVVVSDEVLDDDKKDKSEDCRRKKKEFKCFLNAKNDEQMRRKKVKEKPFGYSRFFSLDAWSELNLKDLPERVQQKLPFLIVPKASKKEKDAGCEKFPVKPKDTRTDTAKGCMTKKGLQPSRNIHPTVKPLRLMSYLVTMGSRENDIVLDPFAGSGTTCIAAKLLNRNYIGIEISSEYREIAVLRIENADKDNAIIKLIRESFDRIKDVKPEKNNDAQAKEKLETHIVCSMDPELRLNVLP